MRDSAHGTPTPSTGGDVAPPPVFRKARRALSVELQRSPSRRAPLRSGDSFFQFPSWRALLFLEKSDASTAEPPRAKRRLSWVDDVRPELRRRAAWLFFSEETFPDAEKEAAFQERWRDENRAAAGRRTRRVRAGTPVHEQTVRGRVARPGRMTASVNGYTGTPQVHYKHPVRRRRTEPLNRTVGVLSYIHPVMRRAAASEVGNINRRVGTFVVGVSIKVTSENPNPSPSLAPSVIQFYISFADPTPRCCGTSAHSSPATRCCSWPTAR